MKMAKPDEFAAIAPKMQRVFATLDRDIPWAMRVVAESQGEWGQFQARVDDAGYPARLAAAKQLGLGITSATSGMIRLDVTGIDAAMDELARCQAAAAPTADP